MVSHRLILSDAQEVFRKESRCYLFGWGAYRDVFWETGQPDHTFSFCFEITFTMPPELARKAEGVSFVHFQSVTDYRIEVQSNKQGEQS